MMWQYGNAAKGKSDERKERIWWNKNNIVTLPKNQNNEQQ